MKVKLIAPDIKKDYVRSLLRARGIENVEEFLNPTYTALQDWRDLENIEKALTLIDNLVTGAHVGLIVDCDVDGFTSAAIISQYLQGLYPAIEFTYYIHDGKAHGLEEHWEEISEENFDLVIVPDAGSNDAEYAEKINCSILVLDHHLTDKAPSENMIVVNNQMSPKYRNKNLSGAGIAYQFCRALDWFYGRMEADKYIDLAALGVCGDMMSGLEVENQYLWKEGFSHINNYFFLTVARKQAYSITGQMGSTDEDVIDALNPISVAFYIVPLINAMIRVGTQEEKERMFHAILNGHEMIPCNKRGAKGTLEEAAVESVRECVNARAHQNKIKDTTVARLEQKIFKLDLLENQILFIRLDEDDKFPPELNGLIAMQLSQKYKRPTIVARLNNEGYIRGSIRGLSNSELQSFKAYLDSTGLFEYVQGHDNAAGCSLLASNLSRLHELANIQLAQYDFGDSYYEVDFQRQAFADDLGDLIDEISAYKNIWSQRNDEPMIYVKDLHFKQSDIQIMGKNKDTIKIVKNGVAYMKFFAKDMIEELKQYGEIKMEVVGKAHMNYWMGTTTPQIFIENYEIKEDKLIDF